MLAGLVLLCLATGLASLLDVQQRRAELAGIAERGGPLTSAAEEIYQSISRADATAAGAFLVGRVDPQGMRESYQRNITAAAGALSTAAAGAPGGDSAEVVSELTAYLPIYTGLIETARTLNRQGLPEGGAYLREASGLAQRTMLPLAEQLYRAESAKLAGAQADTGRLGWFPLAVGALALGGLVAAQIFLARSTRRTLNAGLLVATVATLVAVVWFGVASIGAAGHISASRADGTAQVEAIAEARITALQARSDEALTLVARGNGAVYENHFDALATQLRDEQGGGLLTRARAAVGAETGKMIDQAIAAWTDWLARHETLRKLDDGGGYQDAVQLATTTKEAGTTKPSSTMDDSLSAAIDKATNRFNNEAAQARSAVSAADVAVSVLAVLAALAVGFGFAPRLREFR